ncbi:MAG: hypothetical protein AAGK97_16605, partial [Bacteroidota bacterium]
MQKIIYSLLILLSINLSGQSNWQDIISTKVPEDVRMTSDLFQVAKFYEINPKAALKKLSPGSYEMEGNKLVLEIIAGYDADVSIDIKYMEGLGIHVENFAHNNAEVHIEPKDLLNVAKNLKAPYVLITKSESSDDEGPGLTNISTYNSNGKNGQGVNLGIIDGSWSGLTASVNAGAAPSTYTSYNYTPNPFE